MKLNKIILALLLVCSFSYGNNKRSQCTQYGGSLDPYVSEGNCYLLSGEVFQRIDAKSMLVSLGTNLSGEKIIVYVEGIPKGLPLMKGETLSRLMIKSVGVYEYTTAFGLPQAVIKGVWLTEE